MKKVFEINLKVNVKKMVHDFEMFNVQTQTAEEVLCYMMEKRFRNENLMTRLLKK